MFNLNSKVKKGVISVILIFFIFTSIFSVPTPAKAIWWATFAQQAVQIGQAAISFAWDKRRDLLDMGVKLAATRIMRELTKAIVNWIDSGFQGNPAFITNPGKFMQNTADIAIGDMLKGTALEFLCDPFKKQIKLALGLQYRPFQETIKCSFSGVLGNVNDAMNSFTNGDFINGGGWDSWLQVTTVPQNNAMGALMIAQLEMDDRIAKALDIKDKELAQGSGFMSYKKCKNITTGVDMPNGGESRTIGTVTYDANGNESIKEEKIECETITPGSAIANKLNWADTSDIRKTELANDLNAVAASLVNLVINKMIKGIAGQFTGSSKPKKDTTGEENLTYLRRLEAEYNSIEARTNPNYIPTNIYSSSDGSGSSGTGGGVNGGGSYNSNSSVNFSQNFTDKMSALSAIDNQISIENQYIIAQNNLARLLTATQNAFDSSNCEAPLKDLVIKQITGEYTGTKSLQWNKKDIALATSTANIALNTLNATKTSISATDNTTAVSSLTQNLNSLARHGATDVISSASGGALYEQTRIWIADQIDIYSSSCTVSKSGLIEWGIQ